MKHAKTISRKAFFLSGGAFVALNFLGNVFELGFNAVALRLPEGDYSTVSALFKVFFILITPLTSMQLVVGKEIAALWALDKYGEARYFASRSLRYVILSGVVIMALGIPFAPFLARFLQNASAFPVIAMLIVIAFFAPIPVLYGIIQGLKKFATLGFVTISWGGARFVFSFLVLVLFAVNLHGIMVAVIGAALFTAAMAAIPAREVFHAAPVAVGRAEMRRAFAFTVPIMAALFSVSMLRGADMVLAKRFFTGAAADAYALAAVVGSAFFTLSSIFMVMFPTISHEKTLLRNPIRFLLRSMLFTGGLSLAGILIAWFFPNLIIWVLSVGKPIPAAGPLVRVIGFMILPLSLTYLIANYFLAQHIAGFLPILVGGAVLQIVLLVLMHSTPLVMLLMVGVSNLVTFAGMLVYLWAKNREYGEMETAGR